MNENRKFNYVYTVIPDNTGDLYSVCCRDKNGTNVKVICAVGEKDEAEKFCDFLNKGQVYPCHFEDMYEDYFGRFT